MLAVPSGTNFPYIITLTMGVIMITLSVVFLVRALFSMQQHTKDDPDDSLHDYQNDVMSPVFSLDDYYQMKMNKKPNLDQFVTHRQKSPTN